MALIISSTWDLAPRYGAGAPTLNAPGPTPLTVAITSPAAGSYPEDALITITGTVSRSGAAVTVSHGATNLGSAVVVGTTWSKSWTPADPASAANLVAHASENGDTADSAGVSITITAVASGAVAITSPPAGQYPEDQTISIVGTVSPSGTPVTVTHGVTSLGSAIVTLTNWTLDWTPSTALAAANLVAHAGAVDSSPVSIEIVTPSTPETIFTSVPFGWYIRGDSFVVGSAGNASQLTDKIVGGGHTPHHFSQATDAARAGTLATGGAQNTPCFRLDGVDDRMDGTGIPPGLDGQPRWRAIVIAARTPGTASTYSAAGTNTRHAIRYLTGPVWSHAGNVSTHSVTAQDQTWGLLLINMNGTIADYIEWRGTRVTPGTIASNQGGTTPVSIGCNAGGTPTFGKFDVCEDICLFGPPTSGELAAYKAYVSARYGAAVVA